MPPLDPSFTLASVYRQHLSKYCIPSTFIVRRTCPCSPITQQHPLPPPYTRVVHRQGHNVGSFTTATVDRHAAALHHTHRPRSYPPPWFIQGVCLERQMGLFGVYHSPWQRTAPLLLLATSTSSYVAHHFSMQATPPANERRREAWTALYFLLNYKKRTSSKKRCNEFTVQ
jgi:hypothetical protein